jgi:hypothetical protein
MTKDSKQPRPTAVINSKLNKNLTAPAQPELPCWL